MFIFVSDNFKGSQIEVPVFRTEEGRYLASSKYLTFVTRCIIAT